MTRGFYNVARQPGKESVAAGPPEEDGGGGGADASRGTLNTLPELMRRVIAAGLSGFFLTEEAIRKALGDALPKDWSDFALEQSERTRDELLERISLEIGRTLENLDVAELLSKLMEGSTIEVNAQIRIRRDDDRGGVAVKLAAKRE